MSANRDVFHTVPLQMKGITEVPIPGPTRTGGWIQAAISLPMGTI